MSMCISLLQADRNEEACVLVHKLTAQRGYWGIDRLDEDAFTVKLEKGLA